VSLCAAFMRVAYYRSSGDGSPQAASIRRRARSRRCSIVISMGPPLGPLYSTAGTSDERRAPPLSPRQASPLGGMIFVPHHGKHVIERRQSRRSNIAAAFAAVALFGVPALPPPVLDCPARCRPLLLAPARPYFPHVAKPRIEPTLSPTPDVRLVLDKQGVPMPLGEQPAYAAVLAKLAEVDEVDRRIDRDEQRDRARARTLQPAVHRHSR
jgi:hypothetical protein